VSIEKCNGQHRRILLSQGILSFGDVAMRRLLAAVVLLWPLAGVGGCTWQANSSSQAVSINPFALGSGEPVLSPANGPGYRDGEAQDLRTKH
jgi:hypothetical protein